MRKLQSAGKTLLQKKRDGGDRGHGVFIAKPTYIKIIKEKGEIKNKHGEPKETAQVNLKKEIRKVIIPSPKLLKDTVDMSKSTMKIEKNEEDSKSKIQEDIVEIVSCTQSTSIRRNIEEFCRVRRHEEGKDKTDQ